MTSDRMSAALGTIRLCTASVFLCDCQQKVVCSAVLALIPCTLTWALVVIMIT